mmetsp:Transcript_46395/g.123259  ORF Transcript_46395/g.123259 Transcript_46395/m.123259 type:complete len:248 (+) Transcript_46395:1174-1917(+)
MGPQQLDNVVGSQRAAATQPRLRSTGEDAEHSRRFHRQKARHVLSEQLRRARRVNGICQRADHLRDNSLPRRHSTCVVRATSGEQLAPLPQLRIVHVSCLEESCKNVVPTRTSEELLKILNHTTHVSLKELPQTVVVRVRLHEQLQHHRVNSAQENGWISRRSSRRTGFAVLCKESVPLFDEESDHSSVGHLDIRLDHRATHVFVATFLMLTRLQSGLHEALYGGRLGLTRLGFAKCAFARLLEGGR